jgi:hypothetical protein
MTRCAATTVLRLRLSSGFSEVAARVKKDAHEAQNARLKKGSKVCEFAVGDVVSIYCPARGRGLTVEAYKHKIKWRGPMEVVSRLSATACGMRELSSGQYFERTLCNRCGGGSQSGAGGALRELDRVRDAGSGSGQNGGDA